MEDSKNFVSFIDHDKAKEDSQIIEKDKQDAALNAEELEGHHTRVKSISLSESRIMSIRNTSIY